jgi:hypothetical protein
MGTWFDRCNACDRQRFLGAADRLIAALENMRSDNTLRHVRGDVAQLQDDIKDMRCLIERQPAGGLGPWVFVLPACLCLIA